MRRKLITAWWNQKSATTYTLPPLYPPFPRLSESGSVVSDWRGLQVLSKRSAMACVTLKRPVDVLGSPHVEQQPLAKRKRCGPPLFPSTSSPSASPSRSLKRAKRMLEMDDQPVSPRFEPSRSVSQFLPATPPLHTGEFFRVCSHLHYVATLPTCTCMFL